MGHASLRIDGQRLDIHTVPGSARMKVQTSTGQEFFFDPDRQRYSDAKDASEFNLQSLGIDRDRLSADLLKIDALRRLEVQEFNTVKTNPGERAILFDNGDFKYFVSIEKIHSLAGGYSLAITSQWKTAAHPEEEQYRFRACIDRAGLEQLKSLIERVLSQ